MSGGPVTVELLEALVAATAEAREAVREAHAARKDLRLAIREADDRLKGLRGMVRDAVGEMAKEETQRLFEGVKVAELGAGLKKTFDQWIELLGEANDVLDRLNAKAAQLGAPRRIMPPAYSEDPR